MESQSDNQRANTSPGARRDPVDGPAPTGRRSPAAVPGTVRVLVVTGERLTRRYASWLAERYETTVVHHGDPVRERLKPEVVVVDRQTLIPEMETTGGTACWSSSDCQVLTTVATDAPLPVDDRLAEPVARDELLQRVETARRVAVYERAIAELLSLTTRRRRLRIRLERDTLDEHETYARLSDRIDELHDHIDATLADTESRYAELLGRGHPGQVVEQETMVGR